MGILRRLSGRLGWSRRSWLGVCYTGNRVEVHSARRVRPTLRVILSPGLRIRVGIRCIRVVHIRRSLLRLLRRSLLWLALWLSLRMSLSLSLGMHGRRLLVAILLGLRLGLKLGLVLRLGELLRLGLRLRVHRRLGLGCPLLRWRGPICVGIKRMHSRLVVWSWRLLSGIGLRVSGLTVSRVRACVRQRRLRSWRWRCRARLWKADEACLLVVTCIIGNAIVLTSSRIRAHHALGLLVWSTLDYRNESYEFSDLRQLDLYAHFRCSVLDYLPLSGRRCCELL